MAPRPSEAGWRSEPRGKAVGRKRAVPAGEAVPRLRGSRPGYCYILQRSLGDCSCRQQLSGGATTWAAPKD
ncbi:hypothetical protein NDU88_003299 [Pleurodeles waltl]|uniref:Uncharacterized protein n=1 Tax=Pleurodeles waltl TaxID=8319 RepID=A0AAV7M4T0_PLEWA|nr:hypothetical protein NDU88_003299 [Pleurodeles waltl]